jgi:hypothetical protein
MTDQDNNHLRTYRRTNDLGFTEISTVFPVLPNVEEPPTPKLKKIINTTKKIGWRFWMFLTGVAVVIGWIISNHTQIRTLYDTYQPSTNLPKLPPVINDNKGQEKKPSASNPP